MLQMTSDLCMTQTTRMERADFYKVSWLKGIYFHSTVLSLLFSHTLYMHTLLKHVGVDVML